MTTSTTTITGAALRTARQAAGLSQSQLAERWGVRQATISAWEAKPVLSGLISDAIRALVPTR